MAAPMPEAERLRRLRLMFERSNRDGIPMSEARSRAAEDRWREAEQRLAARCGTRAPDAASDRPIQWWQRDDL